MSTQYHIYANNHAGAPVDYSTIVATVAGLTYSAAALGLASDTTFAVRAFDSVSTLEEMNTDATTRVVVDGAGVDVTGRPGAPGALVATGAALNAIRAAWTYPPVALAAQRPIGFHVYAGTPTVSYGSPVATVPYTGRPSYTQDITGLTGGSSYQVAVRAYNPTGEEPNVVVATAIATASGPTAVDSLTATAVVSP
jgi:hypothetical protein